MAHYDTAWLLQQAKLYTQRPTTDASMTDIQWYTLFTEAQENWYGVFSVHAPWAIMTAPTQLTSSDSNVSYDFPNDDDGNPIVPRHMELYDKLSDGRPLRACAWHDTSGDYIWEGSKIRFPGNRTRTFSSGPYSRFITWPSAITASQDPTLQPIHARKLIVYSALVLWATRGNIRDPKQYQDMEDRAWYGDPMRGMGGILSELKMANPFQGTEAITSQTVSPTQNIDTGAGYTAL